MKILPFKSSALASLGIELEFQIIHPHTYSLVSRAKDLIRFIKESPYQKQIKPEITQSMIEINSDIHQSPAAMLENLSIVQSFLLMQGEQLNILFCGGGTHPFQKWSMQKIFPTTRYKNLSYQYQYLSKRATVFGQHVHVGCQNGEEALYLTHALTRYVPHFIAMAASSPFYQGVDTGYQSTRATIFNSFPLSGVIPFLTSWESFSDYYYKLFNLGIITSMKDFYWDIRPKPEFGTVEIRVCDMPLTIKKAVLIAAYIQTIALYLLKERPISLSEDLYFLYNYNRFQACRYGFDGRFINPNTLENTSISEDVLFTIKEIEYYANLLNNMGFISQLFDEAMHKQNDAIFLRESFKHLGSLPKVVKEQCEIWIKD